MASKYTYSFVVYAYNQQDFISEAVRAALMQDCQPIEIVLSDDCSDDDTFDVMKNAAADCDSVHRIVLNRNNRNLGTNAHLNLSHKIASGDIIIAAGGDDISHLDRARRIIQLFEESDTLLVHSLVNPIDQAGRPIPGVDPRGYLSKSRDIKPHVAATAMSLYVGASAAWNRELFDKYGPILNPAAYEDLILGFRALLEGKVQFIDDRLLDYRAGRGRSYQGGMIAASMQEHRHGRLLKHKRELAVLSQRLSDCRTFGLEHQDPLVLRIQRALQFSKLSVSILEGNMSIGRLQSLSILWRGARLRLRELLALLKWWVRRMSAPPELLQPRTTCACMKPDQARRR